MLLRKVLQKMNMEVITPGWFFGKILMAELNHYEISHLVLLTKSKGSECSQLLLEISKMEITSILLAYLFQNKNHLKTSIRFILNDYQMSLSLFSCCFLVISSLRNEV